MNRAQAQSQLPVLSEDARQRYTAALEAVIDWLAWETALEMQSGTSAASRGEDRASPISSKQAV